MANGQEWQELSRKAVERVITGGLDNATQNDLLLATSYHIEQALRDGFITHTETEKNNREDSVKKIIEAVNKQGENATKKTVGIAGGISLVFVGIIEGARAGLSHIRF